MRSCSAVKSQAEMSATPTNKDAYAEVAPGEGERGGDEEGEEVESGRWEVALGGGERRGAEEGGEVES